MATSIARFVGKIYPDHSFSIGYRKKPQKKVAEKEYDREWEEQHDSYEYEHLYYGKKVRKEYKFFDKPVTPSRFIDGSESSQKKKPKKKYGKKGITSLGRKTVKNTALILQRDYGAKRLGFVTCTLPGYSRNVMLVISKDWNNIVRKFFQQLRRDLKNSNAPLKYVGVTEVQEKRWKRHKICALHLHFAYVALTPDRKRFYLSSHRFREVWERVVNRTLKNLGLLHGCNEKSFNASIDCQIVRKNVAGYLGKYISKGCKVTEDIIEQGFEDSLPSQWWTASTHLKRDFRAEIVYFKPSVATDIFFSIDAYVRGNIVSRYHELFIKIEDKDFRVGMSGELTEIGYLLLVRRNVNARS